MRHVPVLSQEIIRFLKPSPGKFFIDGTVGGGGHASEILKYLGGKGRILGLDWDKEMLEKAKEKLSGRKNVILAQGNYADLREILKERKLPKADGLLLDLGFSSEQLESGRGFSFQKDEPLLMTYEKEREPVREILRKRTEKDLAEIIFQLSGERFAKRIAKAIKQQERKTPIETSGELNEVIKNTVPRNYERGRIAPATRTFQALRIYANEELENLEKALSSLSQVLKSGGRAAIISFHSLEDRTVKNKFRDLAKDEMLKIITKKPIRPSLMEMQTNPRSRSARLRVAELI